VRDDFLQIVHFSHQLPEHAPATALWPRIRAGVAELQPRLWSRPIRWWAGLRTLNFNLSVPQIAAGAAALVIVISIGVIVTQRENRSFQPIDGKVQQADVVPLSNVDVQQLEKRINSLSRSVEERKNSWDPELRTTFERNLYYIDQSLTECRHQLKDNPADDVSQELMLNAYREKVRLLEGFEKF